MKDFFRLTLAVFCGTFAASFLNFLLWYLWVFFAPLLM